MERLAVELHDSAVERINSAGADVVLELSLHVHASSGRPGWDAGRGWYQDAEMVLSDARVSQRPSDDFLDIAVGSVLVDDQLFDNMLSLPCDIAGRVEIKFSGREGTLAAAGKAVRIKLKGEPGPVELFRPS